MSDLENRSRYLRDIEILLEFSSEEGPKLLKYLKACKSQLKQDLFVLSQVQLKQKGFFVEFGATNGFDLSNSYLLEKEFGWSGILVEPARCWHDDLRRNRNCIVETDCVWKESGKTLVFNEVSVGELSTIASYSDTDSHANVRKTGKTYEVKTVSLTDLLHRYQAPREIDYLSIDTEGSEFEILNNFDFVEHQFRVITCEHNYTPMREKIFDLLCRNGFTRVFEDVSMFDDWYVKL